MEKKTEMILSYEAPQLEVIEVEVEKGFAQSAVSLEKELEEDGVYW